MSQELELVTTALWEASRCFPEDSLQEQNRYFAASRVESLFVGSKFKNKFYKVAILDILWSAWEILDEAEAHFLSRNLMDLHDQICGIEVAA